MMGISNQSGKQYQQAYKNALNETQIRNEAMANLTKALTSGAGYYFGGPTGAQVGSMIGGNLGNFFS